MTIEFLFHSPLSLGISAFLLVIAYHILAWLWDEHGIRDIPGPRLAAFSDAWLGYWAAQGCRSEHLHKMHLKYGRLFITFGFLPIFVLSTNDQLNMMLCFRKVGSNGAESCLDC
jgi:hypothetical protein